MFARVLLPLFALAMSGGVGQMGLYGPVMVHVKAGDRAPDVSFAKVLSQPEPGALWSDGNLSGKVTVLAFYLNTSLNPQPVDMWNKVVDEFAEKPVQFVWITGESEFTLAPWLKEHPVKGWVLDDPEGQTGKAYGLDMPVLVYIGPDRKIIGFDRVMIPRADNLNAVREGRVTTTRPTKATLKAFIESKAIVLDAEPWKLPRPDEYKPNFPPSETVHVSVSEGEERGNSSGMDFWSLKGYSLREVVEEVYGVNAIRLDLPAALDDGKRYDFALVLPQNEDREQMKVRMQQGIQDYFHLTERRESRRVDAYVVTAVEGRRPPAMKAREDEQGGSFRSSSIQFENKGGIDGVVGLKPQPIDAIRAVYLEGTMDEFCHQVERQLNRPVVNETELAGKFDLRVEGSKDEKNDFLERLRAQDGLVITPGERNVEMLVFEAR